MRNVKISKSLAATLATAMVFSSTAFAATPTTPTTPEDTTDPGQASTGIEGDGQLEGYVNKDVFRVVLPTIENVDFTLDPQGLLKGADPTNFPTGAGAVYFVNDGTDVRSDKSDAIEIINKCSYDIDVALSVSLDTGDVALAKKADLASATEPSVYLGLIKDTDAAVAIESESYESTFSTVGGVDEVDGTTVTKGYKITGTKTPIPNVQPSPNGYYYSYALTDNFTNDDAEKITYKLEGACDTKADWSEIATKAVTADIAWTIAKNGTPRASGSTFNRSANNTYALANVSQEIKSIAVSVDGKTPAATVPAAAYTLSADKSSLTISGTKAGIGAAAEGKSRYFLVTFADDTSMVFSVKVTNTGEFPYSRAADDNTYSLTGNTLAIKSIGISVDGTAVAATMPTDSYTLAADKETLTIDGTKAGIGAAAEGSIRFIIVTFSDDTTTTFSVNVAE